MATTNKSHRMKRWLQARSVRLKNFIFPCEKRFDKAKEEFEAARKSLDQTIDNIVEYCKDDNCEDLKPPYVFVRTLRGATHNRKVI